MNNLHHNSGEFSKLKSLLLGEEQQVLADIETVVRKHDLRIGDDEALQHSVAGILAEALREAEVKNHRELATAIAPVIVAAIRQEIRNASDEVVDAMYPIMGRLIRAYVASAIRDFVEGANRRIEGGLSARFIRLRIKSLITHTPYRTLLIREGGALRVTNIYLIERSSGTLIEAWNADPNTTETGDDHLIGGMLTAINNFAAESFAEGESELRALDLGEARVFLKGSASCLVAMKTVGKGSRRVRRALDAEMYRTLEMLSDTHLTSRRASREALADLAERVTLMLARYKEPPILALAVFGGLTILMGLIVLQHQRERAAIAAIETDVREVIAERQALQAFPLDIQVASDRSSVTVAGLVPTANDRAAFVQAAQERLGKVRVNAQLEVIPNMTDYRRLSGAVVQAETRVGEVERNAAIQILTEAVETRAQIEALNEQLEKKSAALDKRLAELHLLTQDPHLRLSQWVATHAIFFANEITFRDPGLALQTLSALKKHLKDASGARIRIIGYTDPTGTAEGNDALARLRAERVAAELIRLGVSRDRLKILGRPSGILLSYDKGPFSSNRRVEFELAYDGEPTRPKGEPLATDGTRP